MIRDLAPESEPWARAVDQDVSNLATGVTQIKDADDNNHRFITSGMNQLQQRVKLVSDLQRTPVVQAVPLYDASQVVWTGWVNNPTVQAVANMTTPTGRIKIDIQGPTYQNPMVIAYSIQGIASGRMYVDRDYLRSNPGRCTYNSSRRGFLSVIQDGLPTDEVFVVRVELWTPITINTNLDGKPMLFLTMRAVM